MNRRRMIERPPRYKVLTAPSGEINKELREARLYGWGVVSMSSTTVFGDLVLISVLLTKEEV